MPPTEPILAPPRGRAPRLALCLLTLFTGACAGTSGLRGVPAVPPPADVLPGGRAEQLPVEVLDHFASYRFEADGTKVYTQRLRYRIRRRAELGPWATVTATWSPWYQARPEVSATVTTSDGRTVDLDPSTFAERPVASGQPGLYTDRRQLEAPLPALAPGSVVEHTVVRRDERPQLAAGALDRHFFGLGAPTARAEILLDVPEGIALSYQVRGLALEPEVGGGDGRRTVRFVATDVPALGPTRMHLTPEHPRHPHVAFTTARSWGDVAAAYGRLVDERIDGADVSALMRGLDASASRDDKIRALLARLHAEIRYTALELGEQAVLPRSPEETLARRFGDCKDKSTLLVALLRAAGIDAHVATLRGGFGQDVPPELPGLELFDHVIVYVPGAAGEAPVWIDTTAELVPFGELPPSAQGRWAMIARAGGPGLVRTPEAGPEAHRYLEVRRVPFPDFGKISVTERTEATGAMEARLRSQIMGSGRSQLERALTGYVTRAYRAEGLGEFDYGDPRDMKTPFAVQVQAVGSSLGYADHQDAKMQLRAPVLFGFLPDILRDAALGWATGEEDAERRAAALLVRTRKTDFMLPFPFEAEVRYEIQPPAGFTLTKQPEAVDIALGPGRYRATFERRDDGGLVARFSMATGPRRWTADEMRAFVEGLATVWELAIPTVELAHGPARDMAEGRWVKGLAGHAALVDAAPKVAAHRVRYARALLDAGLGLAARAEAKQAVALAPKSTEAWLTLGRALEADPYGRPLQPGFDRAASIAAYEKALALDAEAAKARLAIARLHERDASGARASDPADWTRAAQMYRGLRDVSGDERYDGNLLFALLWARDFAGLHDLASKLTAKGPTVGMQLTAAAELRGVKAALQELEALALDPPTRREAFETSAKTLSWMRDYDKAAAITEAAVPSAADPLLLQVRLARLRKLRRVAPSEAKTPEGAVRRLLYRMLASDLGPADVRAMFSKRAFDGDAPKAEIERVVRQLSVFQRGAAEAEIPIEVVRDNILSLTRFEVTGNRKAGFRVEGKIDADRRVRQSVWFVVAEGGGYRLRASETTPSALGEEAAYRLRQGDVRGARLWLDWAEDLFGGVNRADVLGAPPFLLLRDAKAPLVLQAAALVAMGPRGAEAVRVLTKPASSELSARGRVGLEHARLLALERAERFGEAVPVARRLYDRDRRDPRGFVVYCRSMVRARRSAEVEDFAGARLKKLRRDPLALTCLAEEAIEAGDLAKAQALLQKQVDLEVADPSTLNNVAWLSLFTGGVTEAAIDQARQANALTGYEDPAKLHTLAALLAADGATKEAFHLFVKRLELRGAHEPEPIDGYLLGRIYEHYGRVEEARAAYRTVAEEPRAVDSTHRLAAERLRALEASTKAKVPGT